MLNECSHAASARVTLNRARATVVGKAQKQFIFASTAPSPRLLDSRGKLGFVHRLVIEIISVESPLFEPDKKKMAMQGEQKKTCNSLPHILRECCIIGIESADA